MLKTAHTTCQVKQCVYFVLAQSTGVPEPQPQHWQAARLLAWAILPKQAASKRLRQGDRKRMSPIPGRRLAHWLARSGH